MPRKNWWNVNPPRPATLCCNDFWQAMQTGTDNEGYGSLVSYYGRAFHIGSGNLPEIAMCPWCGGKPTAPPEHADY